MYSIKIKIKMKCVIVIFATTFAFEVLYRGQWVAMLLSLMLHSMASYHELGIDHDGGIIL